MSSDWLSSERAMARKMTRRSLLRTLLAALTNLSMHVLVIDRILHIDDSFLSFPRIST